MTRIASLLLLLAAAGCSSSSVDGPYSISGAVNGVAQAGVVLTLGGAASATTTTDSHGTYFFDGLTSGTYTVTPSLAGHAFTPSSISVTLAGASAFGESFTNQCLPGLDACGSTCSDLAIDAAHCGTCDHACGLGTCASSQCLCNTSPATVRLCRDTAGVAMCVDIASNNENCGYCGYSCTRTWSGGATCINSSCRCPAGTTPCTGTSIGTYVCTTLQTDMLNCGHCGNGCTGGRVCQAGQCVLP